MSITINPNLPIVAVQGATADVVLQPGTVIKAQVLQVLGHDQAQISIGGQTVEVTTQVPLQAGQTLQLSVSQTADGTIQLAVVDPQNGAAAGQILADQALAGQAAVAGAAAATISDVVTLAPGALANIAAQVAPVVVVSQNQLSAPEQLAVSSAAQAAAIQQTSLAPLFANLSAAAGVAGLPPQVQQAVAQVLAQRTSLGPSLTGDDIKQAFEGSGLFLEASLAAGSVSASATPDLKAALVVLRQVLTTALTTALTGTTETLVPPSATPTVVPQAVTTDPVVPGAQGAPNLQLAVQTSPQAAVIAAEGEVIATAAPAIAAALPAAATALPATATPSSTPAIISTSAPPLAPAIAVVEAASQGEMSPLSQVILELTAPVAATPAGATQAAAASADAAARAAASGAVLNLLQEAVQAGPLLAANPLGLVASDSAMLSLLPALAGARIAGPDEIELLCNDVPPPPLRGALPAAQPVAPVTLTRNASPQTVMHQLLSDSDGAIARQTLLQVASLPQQADVGAGRLDPTAPRWNFEIPFVMAQGTTAMAQFEISRDGGDNVREATQRIWRARFSLNVEPAGPVHALISLSGARTSVRMWAERPATADQLRAGVSQLSQALARAELQPGEIVVRDGAPVQPAAARAGHFLDRAS